MSDTAKRLSVPPDAELQASLASLKALCASDPVLSHANLSDSLLKRTLWSKKSDLKACVKLLSLYVEWHVKNFGSPTARLSILHVHAFLLTGILQVPKGAKDRDGRHVIYMQPTMYKPSEIPPLQVIRALLYLLDVLTANPDEDAAKYGFTFVCNMKGWGWSNFGTSFASQFLDILSGRFPVRIRQFVLVDSPDTFPLIWWLIRPMMSASLAAKFKLIRQQALHTVIDTDTWHASELGGPSSASADDLADFIRELYAREGIKPRTQQPLTMRKEKGDFFGFGWRAATPAAVLAEEELEIQITGIPIAVGSCFDDAFEFPSAGLAVQDSPEKEEVSKGSTSLSVGSDATATKGTNLSWSNALTGLTSAPLSDAIAGMPLHGGLPVSGEMTKSCIFNCVDQDDGSDEEGDGGMIVLNTSEDLQKSSGHMLFTTLEAILEVDELMTDEGRDEEADTVRGNGRQGVANGVKYAVDRRGTEDQRRVTPTTGNAQ